jgi:putative transposase
MKKEHLKLTEADKKYLTELLNKGQAKARVIRRAIGILQLDQGATFQKVAELLGVDYYTVSIWCRKYVETGLQFLSDLPRSGRPIVFNGEERAKITALACSETPDGRAKWSLQLLADKAVELELVETISPSKVRELLKKTNLNRT